MTHDQLFITAALGAMLAFGTPAVHADYLPPSVEARLQSAADHGPDQLRQFVWRTRAIYALRMEDVADRLGREERRDYSEFAGIDADAADGGGEPESQPAAKPQDDSFTREFFRNDARD
jgi:hypothetical protein